MKTKLILLLLSIFIFSGCGEYKGQNAEYWFYETDSCNKKYEKLKNSTTQKLEDCLTNAEHIYLEETYIPSDCASLSCLKTLKEKEMAQQKRKDSEDTCIKIYKD